MKNLLVLLLATLVSASAAHATTLSGRNVYFAVYNFSKTAFDKQVQSVMVHTGVSIDDGNCQGGNGYWDNVQDVDMSDAYDHFQASAKLISDASECKPNKGVIVQYWVTFQDGSKLITEPTLVPILETKSAGYEDKIRAEKEQEALSDTGTNLGNGETYSIRVDETFAD